MGETLGGGCIEIECWREVVPVLFHEARRLTVHVQFRTLKFSLSRREFHIKLSSEEDHCFLYKTAVTQEVYQRYMQYHHPDVPFEQFSDYMHHLVQAVKNGQDPGERFFINILAPPSANALPHSIEFIVTQRQMGCVVQNRRLCLTFTLASDAELKEHLINCFDKLKREKDQAQRRNAELEVDLVGERSKVKELEERNRYLQRELEFSQTLLKSAETIQKHYESLLKPQQRFKEEENTQNNCANVNICDEKSTMVVHTSGNHALTLPLSNNNNNGTSHLESMMNYLTGHNNCAEEESHQTSLLVPSVVLPQQQQHQTSNNGNGNGSSSSSLLSSDTKKLKGAAKRKASFHNLTNPNPANAVNSSLEQLQAAAQANPNHHQQMLPPSHHQQPASSLHEHLARLHEAHHQQHSSHHQQESSSSTSLINPITAMNLLDDRHDMYSMGGGAGTSDSSFLGGAMMRDYLSDVNFGDHRVAHDDDGLNGNGDPRVRRISVLQNIAVLQALGDSSGGGGDASLSPTTLSNVNGDLIDHLTELHDDGEWSNMKMEYGDDFGGVDLADASRVTGASSVETTNNNGYGTPSLHINSNDGGSVAAASAGSGDDGSPHDARNLNFDGVLTYFKCLMCDGSFTVGSSHMVQHVTESRRCTICAELPPFDSKDELVKHMIGHSTRVYACQYCGKENPRVHYLKIHVRSHTGEKPYTCHQCGRGFADASTWRRHERVHTGEKPYQCNICGRKIARRDNVKIHMRSHMRTKAQLVCRTCGKSFTQANHLALHERICISEPSTGIGDVKKPLNSSSPFAGASA